jgi:hypothetical protein
MSGLKFETVEVESKDTIWKDGWQKMEELKYHFQGICFSY